ncbi:MAG TPA: IPTL-CTERM sorting domain-containing protein [Thermoanaerobaculia bacterium]|nr:IPTL-CTERM sorting domain-containing protein [Thermoanaerobaculia bacterium]
MRKAALLLLALCFLSGNADAIPVVWQLNGVTFADGGTASGSFVYDSSTNTYSSVNITTTPGTVLATGATFLFVSPGVSPTSSGFLAGASNVPNLTGTRAFALFFASPLSSNGGLVNLSSGLEASCANATCGSPAAPSRSTNAGSVNGTATSPIPTLSAWALLATGLLLAAAGFAALRRGVF